MRRPPPIATLVVVAAVLTMVALGIWQLRRAAWKEQLLADYTAAQAMSAVDLDPLLDGRTDLPPLSFRRALVTCHAVDVAPQVRAGRSAGGEAGQVYLIPCRPGARGLAGRLRVNAGWASRPEEVSRVTLNGIVAGRLSLVGADEPVILTAATGPTPLAPSAPASIENIPNNHRLYALQWFFFASAAAVIFFLAVRRRGATKLPPEP